MIVPMKHITLLCVDEDRKHALAELAKLGLVDVETKVADTVAIAASQNAVESARRAQLVVALAAKAKDPEQISIKEAPLPAQPDSTFVGEVNRTANDYAAARDRALDISREIRQYAPWGDFRLEDAEALAKTGLPVALFTLLPKAEPPESGDGGYLKVGADRNAQYFAAVGVEPPEGAVAVPMPRKRLAELKAELNGEIATVRRNAKWLAEAANRGDEIRGILESRMNASEYVAVSENMSASGVVLYLTGFIDARQSDNAIAAAHKNGWGVALRDPEPDDNVPTKLEPPRLFRPILALFKAIGITPGYTESDVSVPFFMFFSIFFAMLVGDAGYGTILLLMTLVFHRKFKAKARAKGEALAPIARSGFTLLYVFSTCTIIYGILSGTYFAMPQEYIPEFLRFKTIDILGDQSYIMQICFALGATHLTVARLWNAAVLYPSRKMLAEIGWIGVIWSMFLIVCSIVMEADKFTYPSWGPYVLGGSILMVALFMLDKSELRTDGISLAMLPLNIMSSMGDVISYVRLYAVGLASVQLATNFNSMATGLDLPIAAKIPLMVLILGFGHALNFAMGALSILVHGVRLNTLEFSGAKGVSWSGRAFKPFTATEPEPAPAASVNADIEM